MPTDNRPANRDRKAWPTRLIVVGEAGPGRQMACQAATLAGARLLATVDADLDALAARLSIQVDLDGLLVELAGVEPDRLDGLLDLLVAMRDEAGEATPGLILSFETAQLDQVAARMQGPRLQLLCEPNLAERVTAIGLAATRSGTALSDLSREDERDRLQRLDEEVARIADALARLAGRDPVARRPAPLPDDAGRRDASSGGVLRERAPSYGAPPMLAIPASDDVDAANTVRAAIRARRMRAQFFDGALFADPAWDMLLDLYAAKLEHQRVSVSSLCIAAAVPPTTALRWITTLSDVGLFDREADPLDKRRASIILTDEAAEAMRLYIQAIARAGLSIG